MRALADRLPVPGAVQPVRIVGALFRPVGELPRPQVDTMRRARWAATATRARCPMPDDRTPYSVPAAPQVDGLSQAASRVEATHSQIEATLSEPVAVAVDASAIDHAGERAASTGQLIHAALSIAAMPIVLMGSIDQAIAKANALRSVLDAIGSATTNIAARVTGSAPKFGGARAKGGPA